MRHPRLLLLAGLLGALRAAAAAPLDLGDHLIYYRVHALPADLPGQQPAHAALILDLRFVAADGAEASALGTWIRFNASVRSPVYVLENGSTAAAVRAAVPAGWAGVVVVAPRAQRPQPDIGVSVSAEDDRKSYEALDKGAPVESLLRDYPDKPRVDEAYLDKEHIPDSEAPDAASDQPPPPMPLVDVLLQRAVQIHRGLSALGRR